MSQEEKFSPSEHTGQSASYFPSNAECVLNVCPLPQFWLLTLELSERTESPPSHLVIEFRGRIPIAQKPPPLACPGSAELHQPRGRSPVLLLSRPRAVSLISHVPRKHFQLLRDSCNHWKHVLKSFVSFPITRARAGFLTTCGF